VCLLKNIGRSSHYSATRARSDRPISDHNAAVAEIKEAFEKKGFQVQIRGNNLPQGSKQTEAIYRPDMLVRRRGNEDVAWIVEVEASQAGKSVVGAAVLADVCMQIEKQQGRQKGKPDLLFVFYRPSAKLQLARKRLERLTENRVIEHLNEIKIMTEKRVLDEVAHAT